MNNEAYVYQYRVNGIVRYIGKGRGDRAQRHMTDNSRNTPWHRFLMSSIKKDAVIEIDIIAENMTDDEADAFETAKIAEIGRKMLNEGPLMNVLAGGNSIKSEDAQRFAAERNANPAHIAKQQANSLKQMQDPKQIEMRSRKVKCVELNQVFDSIKQANEALNIKGNGVAKVLSPKAPHKTAGGFHWEYA
jgi:hypothetical protein